MVHAELHISHVATEREGTELKTYKGRIMRGQGRERKKQRDRETDAE